MIPHKADILAAVRQYLGEPANQAEIEIAPLAIKPNRPRDYFRVSVKLNGGKGAQKRFFAKTGKEIVQCVALEQRLRQLQEELRAPRLLVVRELSPSTQLALWSYEDGETRPISELTQQEADRLVRAHATIHTLSREFVADPEIPHHSPWPGEPVMQVVAEAAGDLAREDLAQKARGLATFEAELVRMQTNGKPRWLTHHDIAEDNVHWRGSKPLILDWESVAYAPPATGLWPLADLPERTFERSMRIYSELTLNLGHAVSLDEFILLTRLTHAQRSLAFGYRLKDIEKLEAGLSALESLRAGLR